MAEGIPIVLSPGMDGTERLYRATDRTLNRQVAIKVLPESLASDAERIARFEREAKTLASLRGSTSWPPRSPEPLE